MDFIGVLIFVVVVILSIASKAQEARKAEQREREKAERQPQQLSGKASQQIHGRGETMTATAKRGAVPPPPPPQRPRREPRPVEQELMETLFGVKSDKEETAAPPQVERSVQQTVQRVREAREAQPSSLRSGSRATPEDVRRKQEQVRKKQGASRQKQEAARRHAHDQEKRARQKQRKRGRQREQSLHDHPYKDPPRVAPVARKSFLFNNARDVQRAVIYAEILGPPKSTREEPTWF